MRKIYNFLSSVRLAVVIFFLLAAGSMAGTLIEQGLSPEEYITRYGEKWYSRIQFVRLTDVYHSWWFSGLLIFLAINLAACLSKRFPAIWRAYSAVDCDFTHNLVLNFRHHSLVPFRGGVEDAGRRVETSLKELKYKLWFEKRSGTISMFATKGSIGRLGPVISHTSIFIILIGAALSGIAGFRSFLKVHEGVPVSVPHGNFSIVLDKFWIDYYENGRVKDYFSTLTVIDHGKSVLKKTIQINDPLHYKGIWFYQNGDADTPHQYSELQISKDPGVNVVWLGSVLLMTGLLISFFIFHRRLWISIMPTGNSAMIYIGGISNKDTGGLEAEMDRLICKIQPADRPEGVV